MFRTKASFMSKVVKLCQNGAVAGEGPARLAAALLARGEVIGVPTDTIYGIAGLVQNPEAVARIYSIKGRDPQKPIAICVDEIEKIYKYAEVTVSEEVLSSLLPGPVTLVFTRTDLLNRNFNPDTSLIGVRIPDYSFIRQVCALSESPLALTSANYSASQSTLAVEEFSDLHPRLGAVFDGGRLVSTPLSRLGSTVADLSEPGTYRILRPGSALDFVERVMVQHGLLPRL